MEEEAVKVMAEEVGNKKEMGEEEVKVVEGKQNTHHIQDILQKNYI